MMLKIAALIAGLAAIARGFLIPPSISSDVLPFELRAQSSAKTVELECTKCPVAALQPSGLVWMDGVENKLQLQFFIEHQEIDALYLNGFQVFPPLALQSKRLGAIQIAADRDINTVGYLSLGYQLTITPVVKSEQDQLELIAVHLQIFELSNKFVDGLESVVVKLLKTPEGKLIIGDIDTAPTTNPGGKDCNTLICKLRMIVANKMSLIKSGKKCDSKNSGHKALPAGGRHRHGDKGSHHNRKHHGLARLLHALKSIAFHVLIPVFIGILAGFTAGLIGLIVGNTIVFFWRTFYRRGRKCVHSKASQGDVTNKFSEIGEDETKSFLEHQDPPPIYEDVVEDEKSAK